MVDPIISWPQAGSKLPSWDGREGGGSLSVKLSWGKMGNLCAKIKSQERFGNVEPAGLFLSSRPGILSVGSREAPVWWRQESRESRESSGAVDKAVPGDNYQDRGK